MDELIRETYLIHADTREYRRSAEILQDNIRISFRQYRKPYCSFSGGKDSLVMTHAVLQEYPGTMVFHWDYGPYYMPRHIENEILDIATHIGAKTLRVESTWQYGELKRTAKGVLSKVLYGRILPGLKREGYDLSFIGLRAEESLSRRYRTRSLFENDTILRNAFPVRHMKTRDIWTYIVSNNLPYCSHYDRYGALVGWENTRFCTYFDPEFAPLNGNYDGYLKPEFRNYG